MEEFNDNIFQRQAQVPLNAKIKVGKPPTRLQKQAPSSLLLDQISSRVGTCTNPFLSSNPRTPIPLLSPLIASPPPSPSPEVEEFQFPVLASEKGNDQGCNMNNSNKFAAVESRGWQHPAVGNGYMESSSLFAFFQSKCVLVPHAQY